MSAPTPAPGDDRPREGYYPDPSIPGYVRYWNGSAWVPGTSRPAPSDGAPLNPPPATAPVPQPAAAPSVEETGPHFFDEDPQPGGAFGAAAAPAETYGSAPEPASAWGADRSRQSGFGGDQDRRVSWGAPAADPRVAAEPPAAEPGTFVFRRPAADAETPAPGGGPAFAGGAAGAPAQGADAGAAASAAPADEGTMTFRAVSPRAAGGPGFGAGKAAADRAQASAAPAAPSVTAPPAADAPSAAPPAAAPPAAPRQTAPGVPSQAAAPASGTPLTSGPGGGQSSWAQQVHRLAGGTGDDQPVAPWKPPVDDVFQAAARRQAEARPAGLGKRLAARLIDSVVVLGITAAAAVPLGTKALDHLQGKIDEAKQSGETVTVWLLDGTTSVYLGIVLAVLLLAGVLYEALPTAKWGRTLGKKALGLDVRDIEGHEPPGFGAALRRWLVYSVPGLLLFGVVGVLWCLFDRPWRQCWHDKAAHTFVAG
ncbi:RDD family protein [Streptomyces sp. NPDC058739]|uniref:RDD family protein n=1 Tax=Streptomyces sp. NPDC058739 TaxID=3346618 RepID=UPI003684DA75